MSSLTTNPGASGASTGTGRAATTEKRALASPVGGIEKMSLAPYALLALAFIGIADAFYDSYMIYTGQPLWCPPPIDGCNIVAESPYARIAGVPLGYFGVAYYVYTFGLAALLAFDPFSRGLRLGAVLLAALGVIFSIYFMYVQVSFIHAFCIYCLISAVLTLLLLVAAAWHAGATRAGDAAAARATGAFGKSVTMGK